MATGTTRYRPEYRMSLDTQNWKGYLATMTECHSTYDECVGAASVAPCGVQTRRTVYARFLRRWPGRAKPRGLLVPRPLRRGPGRAGQHLFWRLSLRRPLSLSRCAVCGALRPAQHDGLHASPLEHFPHAGATHAKSASGYYGVTAPL